MNIINHILGFPRIGINRELKTAQEKYWNKKISQQELMNIGKKIRKKNWEQQKKLGIDLLPVGDFAWYDHVLTTSMMLGNIPDRHRSFNNKIGLDTLFFMSRGISETGNSAPASEMKKWFNTNYHYIVPEFTINTVFQYSWNQLIEEIDEALSYGHNIKPVLLGPLSYLWLGKEKDNKVNKLDLLNNILNVYKKIIKKLNKRNIEWVQIDEPILSLDLPTDWLDAFIYSYKFLYNNKKNIKILLTTYFGSVEHNMEIIRDLSIDGIHLDILSSNNHDLIQINESIPNNWLLSLGIINGRNIWKTDLVYWFYKIKKLIKNRKKIFLGSSCSLLHSPIDLNCEKELDQEIKSWFSFAIQKCTELYLLKKALLQDDINDLQIWSEPIFSRSKSNKVHNTTVKKRILEIENLIPNRNKMYKKRIVEQKEKLQLPILPTTTIGSFPQTKEIRKLRSDFINKKLDKEKYIQKIKKIIFENIQRQESLSLDVLVHGEPERNDMVEYFGQHLNGFAFTSNGWVQSYGSRCVKPPIIIGDIYRDKPITIELIKYAQSLTKKPVKGMLTGPVTILCWSFPREDLSKKLITKQIALALQDEVLELENSGINIIQIDEPALREGLPLRKKEQKKYLKWAVESFKLSCYGVKNSTQIHTHMCYCEFQDIIQDIINLDVDVITIETSRSSTKLLSLLKKFNYPNEIGLGIYNIHSPNIPSIENMKKLLNKFIQYFPIERLWVNPDCGLKTRNWIETENALQNMVETAKKVRKDLLKNK
ncbi:5-methyltetrahydropteroyltriglutamate--homocysteine S-methyltransferase [Buchnera aphidicola (Kurisakia onigurumii)]|uniref:5-methyltetrahydropteroyltriglutamate-- homocysteine S-methyltransferase n=1 Tax=Buchnera aphidicola TaxID=9 RepID=UPI0031B6FEB4